MKRRGRGRQERGSVSESIQEKSKVGMLKKRSKMNNTLKMLPMKRLKWKTIGNKVKLVIEKKEH